MTPITYALQFRGRALGSPPADVVLDLAAPSCALVTRLLADGVQGRYELAAGGEARLRAELSFEAGDRFRTRGTISFGQGHELSFQAIRAAQLTSSPDPHLKHASVISEILEGEGQFKGAYGRIVSNVLVSNTGEITDNHLGVIFVAEHA